MVTLIPHRYSEPKWQAAVPESQAFVFDNDYKVHNMWELKQALATLPEETIRKFINPQTNHIANWVENVINDKDLATALRAYDHRWGLIVALERQMMRTLNLPGYIASRWLSNASFDFTFSSGQKVMNLTELANTLDQITEETFQFHLERFPNDISRWVTEVIGDYLLGDILAEVSNKEQAKRFVEDHLIMLKEAKEN